MRIMSISANFPPYHLGGYGIRVGKIMDGLASRGHDVLLLTTRARKVRKLGLDRSGYPIYRRLHNTYKAKWFPKELLYDLLDKKILEETIQEFNPQLIYLGHIYPITKQLLPFLSTLDCPILCDEGGNSLKGAWTDHGRWFRLLTDFEFENGFLNKLLPFFKKIILSITRGKLIDRWAWPEEMSIVFNSELNLQNARYFGVPVQKSRVIHSGVDASKFSFKPRQTLSSPLKILIPGRIEKQKGQIDGVRLLKELANQGIRSDLLLIGTCSDIDYCTKIKDEIDQIGLQTQVVFQEMVPHEELASYYHESDICFFSSYHHSGFSRVPLEAMACGCVVLSYGNEGSDELIENERNGFIVDPENLYQTVNKIRSLMNDPGKYQTIITSARKLVEDQHSLDQYIDKIEVLIQSIT